MKLSKTGFVPCNFRYLEVSIEEWLEDKERQLEDQGQVELVFRPFLRWLDRNIEDVVTEGLRQVITLHRVMMLLTMTLIKGHVQGLGWFLTWFPLMFAENNDVGEIVIWGL